MLGWKRKGLGQLLALLLSASEEEDLRCCLGGGAGGGEFTAATRAQLSPASSAVCEPLL